MYFQSFVPALRGKLQGVDELGVLPISQVKPPITGSASSFTLLLRPHLLRVLHASVGRISPNRRLLGVLLAQPEPDEEDAADADDVAAEDGDDGGVVVRSVLGTEGLRSYSILAC